MRSWAGAAVVMAVASVGCMGCLGGPEFVLADAVVTVSDAGPVGTDAAPSPASSTAATTPATGALSDSGAQCRVLTCHDFIVSCGLQTDPCSGVVLDCGPCAGQMPPAAKCTPTACPAGACGAQVGNGCGGFAVCPACSQAIAEDGGADSGQALDSGAAATWFLQSDPCGGSGACATGTSCGIGAYSLTCCSPADFANGGCRPIVCTTFGGACYASSQTPEHPTGCCSDKCVIGGCQ